MFHSQNDDPIHVISVPEHIRIEKPPEYETCIQPPSYDDALQLSPAALLTVVAVSLPPAPSYEVACAATTAVPSNTTSISVDDADRRIPLTGAINVCRVTCVGAVSDGIR